MAIQNSADSETISKMKNKEKKINFLNLELTDIKNNKGAVTMQVRSIEHLQTWLTRDSKLSSELNIQPLDLSATLMNENINTKGKWWSGDQSNVEDSKGFSQPKNFKSES